MKVKELIMLLSQFPENIDVVVKGYEGGVDDAVDVKQIGIVKNANEEWYYGRHRIDADSDVQAVFIRGENHQP
jgi:hypothetical protein